MIEAEITRDRPGRQAVLDRLPDLLIATLRASPIRNPPPRRQFWQPLATRGRIDDHDRRQTAGRRRGRVHRGGPLGRHGTVRVHHGALPA
ncbi:hypothetical protein E1285_04260 [Actinomadura sp. 7K507]|nr:hypothetical protein E1285_04260 [Actinomadura sp. 7K507]